LKRGFKSEEKREGGILLNSNNANTTNPSDPEKKIYDWLDKLSRSRRSKGKRSWGCEIDSYFNIESINNSNI
jgi:hypothetical protein